jgi:hypothetical protein
VQIVGGRPAGYYIGFENGTYSNKALRERMGAAELARSRSSHAGKLIMDELVNRGITYGT